jgi:hypothetical protein
MDSKAGSQLYFEKIAGSRLGLMEKKKKCNAETG